MQGRMDGFRVHTGSFASEDCGIMREASTMPTLFFAYNDLLCVADAEALWADLWQYQLCLSDKVAVVATSLHGITDEVFSQCTVEVVHVRLDPWKPATVSEAPELPEPIKVTSARCRDCSGDDTFPGQKAYYLTRNNNGRTAAQ